MSEQSSVNSLLSQLAVDPTYLFQVFLSGKALYPDAEVGLVVPGLAPTEHLLLVLGADLVLDQGEPVALYGGAQHHQQ